MAKAQSSLRTAKKTIDDRPQTERSDNPMDWLFDNPMGDYPDFGFGILRQTYRGYPNLPSEFGGRKLRPGSKHTEPARSDAEITASWADVVLPPGASDDIARPCRMLKALDEAIVEHEPATLIYATLSYPDEIREHHAWNEARAFAFTALALKRKLPTLLVLHNPSIVASDNPIHVHLLISPRRMDGIGFRGFDEELTFNEGQEILFAEWAAFKKGWRELCR